MLRTMTNFSPLYFGKAVETAKKPLAAKELIDLSNKLITVVYYRRSVLLIANIVESLRNEG